MARETFTTDRIAVPVGPFSPAVRARRVHIPERAGRSGRRHGSTHRRDVAAQIEQILKNLEAVLHAAGKTFADVIKASAFLTDMRDFSAMSAVYERHFEAPYPARTTVAVVALPLGAAVEIDVVAR